jgi:exodeoxyribonuclease V alpha subunit
LCGLRGTALTFRLHFSFFKQIKNNYNKNVFNGDIGIVAAIDSENQTVTVNMDGNDTTYGQADLDELVLAYAVSIHKSQGSEYPAVVIPLTMAHFVMLQRNLLYTAITRGKKLVVVIGCRKALLLAVKNDKISRRYTRLRERLLKTWAPLADHNILHA